MMTAKPCIAPPLLNHCAVPENDMLMISTFPLPDRPKPAPLLFYCVYYQTILLVNGEPLGGKGLRDYIYLYSRVKI